MVLLYKQQRNRFRFPYGLAFSSGTSRGIWLIACKFDFVSVLFCSTQDQLSPICWKTQMFRKSNIPWDQFENETNVVSLYAIWQIEPVIHFVSIQNLKFTQCLSKNLSFLIQYQTFSISELSKTFEYNNVPVSCFFSLVAMRHNC